MSLNKVMPQSVRIQVAPGRDLAQGHQVRGIDQAGARECAFCGLISALTVTVVAVLGPAPLEYVMLSRMYSCRLASCGMVSCIP